MCADHHELCKGWAESGECEKNKPYMVGGGGGVGHCRLSCKSCEVCAPMDRACEGRNREAVGFLSMEEADNFDG